MNKLRFLFKHFKSISASNPKSEKKTSSSSINPQESNKNDVDKSNNNNLPGAESIDRHLHYKWNGLDLFPRTSLPWRALPWQRHPPQSRGKNSISIYPRGCDKSSISFGCVLRVASPFSSFSSLLLSPTHLCWFLQRESLCRDINFPLYSHFS